MPRRPRLQNRPPLTASRTERRFIEPIAKKSAVNSRPKAVDYFQPDDEQTPNLSGGSSTSESDAPSASGSEGDAEIEQDEGGEDVDDGNTDTSRVAQWIDEDDLDLEEDSEDSGGEEDEEDEPQIASSSRMHLGLENVAEWSVCLHDSVIY